MIRAYLQILAENTDLSAVLLFEHRSLERKQHARHVPNRDRFEALWRSVLEEGVAAKLFICDDPALTTRAILGILNWTITWYHPDGALGNRRDRRSLFPLAAEWIMPMSEAGDLRRF